MRTILAASLLGLASRAVAQVAEQCATTDVCFKLNIPSNTASSGKGDIFFQISAPSTYQYVALGQGDGMADSNIFVVYTSSSGNNVTLSPRKGTGHVEPKYSSSAEVTLLDGSGVSNGKMVANVKCSNCDSWSGGSMDFSSSKGNWIHAFKSGGALNSDSTSASLSQHGANDGAAFSWDWAAAKGGDSLNPFVAAASGTGVSATAKVTGKTTAAPTGAAATSSCVPRPTTGTFADNEISSAVASVTSWPSNVPTAFPSGFPSEWRSHWPTARPTGGNWYKRDDTNYCEAGDTGNSGNIISPIVSSKVTQQKKMIAAHGVVAALAFVILFPAGAISIRLATFPGVIWLHAAFQIFAYIVYIAAVGLGVYIANEKSLLSNYHPIIGLVLFVVIFFQPIFGWLHHSLFKKYNSRSIWSHVHIWIGRIAITLGIINGGLGFKLALSDGVGSHSGMIAYAVIAAIAWLLMVLATIFGERRKARGGMRDAPPKYEETTSMDTPLRSMSREDPRHRSNPSEDRGTHGYYGQRSKP
ncbi:CBD9-like protein [Lophium mytilinum]|uniref:CBD9-like protein n=1 Tax=Lophium mytilinum TaxID=390894 RepID=A0A6A6RHL1_9PEZI|nr:CBD9-like protein [Lophium mytilinum]